MEDIFREQEGLKVGVIGGMIFMKTWGIKVSNSAQSLTKRRGARMQRRVRLFESTLLACRFAEAF